MEGGRWMAAGVTRFDSARLDSARQAWLDRNDGKGNLRTQGDALCG